MIEIEIPAGTRGLQGPPGPKGRDGNDFDVQIGNTETLEPGSEATASTNKDEEQNILYLNLGIPRGVKGDAGEPGNTFFTTFDVVDGKLICYTSTEVDYDFQLNGNKLEVVLDGNN